MDEETQVQYMLARVLYERFCEFKKFTPRDEPYVDPAMLDYASIAVDMLGYDQNSIDRLERRIR